MNYRRILYTFLLAFLPFSVTKAQNTEPNDIFIGKWVSGTAVGFEIQKGGITNLRIEENQWVLPFFSNSNTRHIFIDTAIVNTPKSYECWTASSFTSERKYLKYKDGTTGEISTETVEFSIYKLELLDTDTIQLIIQNIHKVDKLNEKPDTTLPSQIKNNFLSCKINEKTIILNRLK